MLFLLLIACQEGTLEPCFGPTSSGSPSSWSWGTLDPHQPNTFSGVDTSGAWSMTVEALGAGHTLEPQLPGCFALPDGTPADLPLWQVRTRIGFVLVDGAIDSEWEGTTLFLGPHPLQLNTSVTVGEDEHTLPVAPPPGWDPAGLQINFWSYFDGSEQGAMIYEQSSRGNGSLHADESPLEVHFDL